MAAIDGTVVGIALPSIGRQFHAPLSTLQWVVTGYTLSLAALLLLGGSLGDRNGRRLVFNVGVVWFAVASAACALSPNTDVLIATRVLQGVGAALLTPGSLAIIHASFEPADRSQAIGAWSGLGGVATAAGPFLGGYLISAASWRWIFVINIPLGALVLFASTRHVPETKDPTASGRVDVPGAVMAVIGLTGVTFALIEGPTLGWTAPLVLAMFVAGASGIIAFVLVERRSTAPMLPLSLFRERQFTVTNAVTFLIYAALGGVLFLLPVELQVVNHYSPLASGVALLPITLIMLLFSARSGQLAARIGPRLQMSVGPVVVGTGLALLARSTTESSYVSGVLPAMIVFGIGLAVTVAPLTSTALGAVADQHAGIASAVNNDVARVGGLIAVAVLPTLAGISGSSYLHASELSGGFRSAVLIAGSWCFFAGVVSAIGIRNPARRMEESIEGSSPGEEAVEPCWHCALDGAPLSS